MYCALIVQIMLYAAASVIPQSLSFAFMQNTGIFFLMR